MFGVHIIIVPDCDTIVKLPHWLLLHASVTVTTFEDEDEEISPRISTDNHGLYCSKFIFVHPKSMTVKTTRILL